MPTRSRSHQLETESRRAFEDLMPSKWVVRKPDEDYGIDCEVEVFDERGIATGRKFLVQLKATDEPTLKKALSIRFREDTFQYYYDLQQPVLVVRYHAPTKTLYGRWFHTFDPYYSKKGAKGITFKLEPSDLIDGSSYKNLDCAVQAYRDLRSPAGRLPFSIKVTYLEEIIQGRPASSLAIALRRALRPLATHLEIVDSSTECVHIEITISNAEIKVALASGGGFVNHLGEPSHDYDVFISDVMMGVANALYRVGHTHISAIILKNHYRNSTIIAHPERAFEFVDVLMDNRAVGDALEIASSLVENDGYFFQAQMFLLPAIQCRADLTPRENALLEELLSKVIALSREKQDNTLLSTSYYNFGRHLRRRRLPLEALKNYRLAAKADPRYRSRKYFNAEVGGILFDLGRFKWAAAFYRKAIDLGGSGKLHALYGDALMRSGRYLEAQEAIDRFLEDGECKNEKEPIWRLTAIATFLIQEVANVASQERDSVNALGELEFGPDVSCMEIHKYIQRAWDKDALCARAWHAYGEHYYLVHNDLQMALMGYLVAAISETENIFTWIQCILIAFLGDAEIEMQKLIVWAAYTIHGDDLIPAITEEFKQACTDDPNEVAQFSNVFNSFIEALPKFKESMVVRMLDNDQDDYYTISLGGPPE